MPPRKPASPKLTPEQEAARARVIATISGPPLEQPKRKRVHSDRDVAVFDRSHEIIVLLQMARSWLERNEEDESAEAETERAAIAAMVDRLWSANAAIDRHRFERGMFVFQLDCWSRSVARGAMDARSAASTVFAQWSLDAPEAAEALRTKEGRAAVLHGVEEWAKPNGSRWHYVVTALKRAYPDFAERDPARRYREFLDERPDLRARLDALPVEIVQKKAARRTRLPPANHPPGSRGPPWAPKGLVCRQPARPSTFAPKSSI